MCGWGAGERVVPGLGVAWGAMSWGTDGEGGGQGNAPAGPECPCGTGCGGGWRASSTATATDPAWEVAAGVWCRREPSEPK